MKNHEHDPFSFVGLKWYRTRMHRSLSKDGDGKRGWSRKEERGTRKQQEMVSNVGEASCKFKIKGIRKMSS